MSSRSIRGLRQYVDAHAEADTFYEGRCLFSLPRPIRTAPHLRKLQWTSFASTASWCMSATSCDQWPGFSTKSEAMVAAQGWESLSIRKSGGLSCARQAMAVWISLNHRL